MRIGTVRRPPCGVRKEDYARRNYFDVWLPELAPSAPLVSWASRNVSMEKENIGERVAADIGACMESNNAVL